jgi:hypothetical protein
VTAAQHATQSAALSAPPSGSVLTNQRLLRPWQAGLVLAAYGIALALAGTRLAMRRDVT